MTQLSDLEFRVWWTYQMAADDYGVMRCAAVTIQAANDALAKRSSRAVTLALHQLITVGLVLPFTHQNRAYVCQANWQDFQKIKYPRESAEPIPPAEVLTACTTETRRLFATRIKKLPEIEIVGEAEEARPFLKTSQKVSETFPKSSPNVSETFLENSFARAREEAKGLRLTAMANGKPPDELFERAGNLIRNYAEWYSQHRKGAKLRLIGNSLEFQDACSLCAVWDDARLEKLAAIVLTTDDSFIANTDRSFKIFALKASWSDDKLRQWEAEQVKAR